MLGNKEFCFNRTDSVFGELLVNRAPFNFLRQKERAMRIVLHIKLDRDHAPLFANQLRIHLEVSVSVDFFNGWLEHAVVEPAEIVIGWGSRAQKPPDEF